MEATRRRWGPVDRGMLHLVRLVLDDRWTAHTAAIQLSQTVRDPTVLRRMTLRVRRALDDRPSPIAERAAITLVLAVDGEPSQPIAPQGSAAVAQGRRGRAALTSGMV